MAKPIGVLLMAYGAAKNLDDLERYYTDIRHGRPPSAAQLADLRRRYEAIGGGSPLFAITERQGGLLQEELNRRHSAGAFRVYLGMKHAAPFIADAIDQMLSDGLTEMLGLVLAPHYSALSVGTYARAIEQTLDATHHRRPRVHVASSWHLQPSLLALLKSRIEDALELFSPSERQALALVFSAHSLPQRILEMGDPYPEQLQETGRAVAAMLNPALQANFSWQSAGRTEEPWLGPDILDKIQALADAGVRAILDCPAGFVSDHLEVLFDLDIEAKAHAQKLGVHFERTASLNDDPRFGSVLADVVEQNAAQLS